jgi:plastocyanin
MNARRQNANPAHGGLAVSRRAMLSLGVLVAIVLLLLCAAGCAAPANTVTIHDLHFDPGDVTVAKGTAITWRNSDQIPVQIQSDDFGTTPTVPGQFSSLPLNPGETFTHTFDDTGKFGYSDPFHPYITGTVTVK